MARSNLKKAFRSSKTGAEIESLIHAVNGRLFEIVVEFIRIPKLLKTSDQSIPRGNPQIIWDGLKRGGGVILLVSHYGPWEFLAIGGGLEGFPIHAMGKANENPFIENYIQNIRGRTGVKTLKQIGSIQDVSRLLKENQAVGLLLDQRVPDGEPIEFLGQTAYFSTLPALLAIRYGVEVVPCFVQRKPNLQYFVTAMPPLKLVSDKDLRESLRLNTQLFAKRIEEEILKNPTEWVLWRHNIWKK